MNHSKGPWSLEFTSDGALIEGVILVPSDWEEWRADANLEKMIDKITLHDDFAITPFFFKKVEPAITDPVKFGVFKREVLDKDNNATGETAYCDHIFTINVFGYECYVFFTNSKLSGEAHLFQKKYLDEIGYYPDEEDYTFKINDQQLYVYENDKLIGGVMAMADEDIEITITRKNGNDNDN